MVDNVFILITQIFNTIFVTNMFPYGRFVKYLTRINPGCSNLSFIPNLNQKAKQLKMVRFLFKNLKV